MAEEKEVKKTSARKPRATKAEVQEPSMEEQMQQMMQMMAQQQQMFAMMMQNMQSQTMTPMTSTSIEPKSQKVRPAKRQETGKITKQALRRKYKDTEIFLVNVTTGSVGYAGKHEFYSWDQPEESIPVSIDDLLGMPETFLKTPILVLDEYENEPETLDDVIQCLGLQSSYDYLYLLNDLDADIESVDISRIQTAIDNNSGLRQDIAAIIQQKIEKDELTNSKLIKSYEKILKMNFKK